MDVAETAMREGILYGDPKVKIRWEWGNEDGGQGSWTSSYAGTIANTERRAVMNILHASETPQEAEHEIKYWFGKSPVFAYKRFGVDE